MTKTKIKTLLIEDSGFMRILLSDLLRKEEHIDVIATASNGMEGVEKVRTLKPDVVITDMIMPQYDGLYVVQKLMKEAPLPIILLSSLDRTDPKIFDALKEGAFDFVDKPNQDQVNAGYLPLTDVIRQAAVTDYLKLRQLKKNRNTNQHTFDSKSNYKIIAIGASTGGPSAVESVISNLPANLHVPVIIAQHMPERFIESFASRLAKATGLKVSVIKDGEHIEPNNIYLATGTANMRIEAQGNSYIAKYTPQTYKEFNHPSIDCLFESLADTFGNKTLAVILTGMGKDGMIGLKKIREAGGLTIAQDEESSVVYGMPKAAFEYGACVRQIPLNEIPNFIISAL